MSTPSRRVVTNPTAADDRAATADGLTESRDVLQLRRSLPVEASTSLTTRAFSEHSEDPTNWITLNNRAFAGHPDQSRMTQDRLAAQIAQDWFDPEGFRLHERDGRLAGFCWTKRHPAHDGEPAMGEIYVIGVDPDFQGLGLGRGLVLAGLHWLAEAGERVGMLYVDADNDRARGLYAALGFELHHVDRVYDAQG